jgi:CBS domain-containing protein
MQIGEICTREVVHCRPDSSVMEIAQLMRDHHVGDLIVVEMQRGKPVPVGIVTDRDLVVHVLSQGIGPEALTAKGLMNEELVTAAEKELVYDAISRMRSKGVRRLPVVDADNFLIGVLTADDVVEFLAEELTEVARIVPRQMDLERAAITPSAKASS